MDKRLVEVCQSGNIGALHALLEDNPLILDQIDQIPSTRTPLHLAIIAQKPDFAREIARIKPTFMYKFDTYGYSPIHLASEKGQVEIVKSLLKKGTGLAALVMGEQKFTPLHCAVVAGNVEVLNLLQEFHPLCIWDLTARKETPLHLAVKNRQVNTFLALIRRMNQAEAETLVLKSMDVDGNTVFHLAVSSKQEKVIEAILSIITTGIPIDALNQTQKKEDRNDCTKKAPNNPRTKETANLSQIIITIPPTPTLKLSKQAFIPDFNHIRLTSNRRVVTVAVITGLACFFSAVFDPRTDVPPPASPESGNSLLGIVDLCPNILFTVSNILGFLLSLAIIVAAAADSPRRKLVLVILAAVSGAYGFAIVSKLLGVYQLVVALIILATGGSISTVYIKNWWEEYMKKTGSTGKMDTM